MTKDTTIERITGLVKWFDPIKGFGFVVSDDGGADILLHVNVLRNFGQNSVADNARIVIDTQQTDRGVQAVSVIEIIPPESEDHLNLSEITDIDPEEVAAAPLIPGRVKWFDKGKGFGFANAFGQPEDIFIHSEILRRSGLSSLQPGEALAMRVVIGKRGEMAVDVQPWEAALPSFD